MTDPSRNNPALLKLLEGSTILRDREDMIVAKVGGKVWKVPLSFVAGYEILNGYQILSAVDHRILNFYDPQLRKLADFPFTCLVYTFIVEHNDTPNPNEFFADTILLLAYLKMEGIIHGDLTKPNVMYNGELLIPIDWDQAQASWFQSIKPRKRPEPDLVHLLETATAVEGDTRRFFRRYLAMRKHYRHLPRRRFSDFGCFSGEMTALAAVDGFYAYGYDKDSNFNLLLEFSPAVTFVQENIMEHDFSDTLATRMLMKSQVSICLSAWAYMFKENPHKSFLFLEQAIEHSDLFFFETQLYGDGPGPRFLRTDDDVRMFLADRGARLVENVISLKVGGRDAVRTTFVCK